MYKIKVRLTIKNNVLLYQVLDQDFNLLELAEFLDQDFNLLDLVEFKASNGIRIVISAHPELEWEHKTIYVRGIDRSKDDNLGVHAFNNNAEACTAALQIKQAFIEFYLFLKKKDERDLIDYEVVHNGPYVAFWIKDQVALPKNYKFEPENSEEYMGIRTLLFPEIDDKRIYLRGEDQEKDCSIVSYLCEDSEKAKQMAQKIRRSLDYWMKFAGDLVPASSILIEIKGDFK